MDNIEFSGVLPMPRAERTTTPTVTGTPAMARHAAGQSRRSVVERVDLDALRIERIITRDGVPEVEIPEAGISGRTERVEVDPGPGTRPGALATGPVPLVGPRPRRSSSWLPRYVATLVVADTVAFLLGGLLGRIARFADVGGTMNGVSYLVVLAAAAPAWVIVMAASRAYEPCCLGLGSDEFRRVGNAAARFTAVLAIVVFLFKTDVARGMIVLALPASTALALTFRYLVRQTLHGARGRGRASHRVLVVGEGSARDALAARLQASPHAGLRVVGACRPTASDARGDLSVAHVRRAVTEVDADTVAVAHSAGLTPQVLRRVSWALEGTGVDLLVAPALTDVAGPRIHVRPVSGLPLLQIAEPEFSGAKRVLKRALDLVGAAVVLLLASPVLLLVAVGVRLGSPGPVIFRQIRIGRDGVPFSMWKFRSMFVDAEDRLIELHGSNDHGAGVLFKMRDDPRVTGLGRTLRKYSLDELPQLFNVLRGQMSLVGPRPPLPSEVARYERDVHRRLLVTPGMTGLWQVSGRSDLDWSETVRLDLYYVENWSVALDTEILWKTLSAVLRGSGAR